MIFDRHVVFKLLWFMYVILSTIFVQLYPLKMIEPVFSLQSLFWQYGAVVVCFFQRLSRNKSISIHFFAQWILISPLSSTQVSPGKPKKVASHMRKKHEEMKFQCKLEKCRKLG